MNGIYVLIEHRQGIIRDISFELLGLGRSLARKLNLTCTGIILGHNTEDYVKQLKTLAHRLLVVDNPVFKDFNAEAYQLSLVEILKNEKPFLFLIGHTAMGIDLCPALATNLNLPFTTDCIDIEIFDKRVRVIRSVYDGKLNAKVLLREDTTYFLTCRSGSFSTDSDNLDAEVIRMEVPISAQPEYRKFVEYIEAAVGEVDITKADIIVSIGRGIKDKANLPLIEDFTKAIGGVIGCTRPVVDAGWLPKDRQIGSSGKTVKPKLYIALGISGTFQHIAGMKNSDTIIAINKDPNAPIFNEADYGIVEDLFKVVPVLKNKILEIKQAK